MTYKLILNFNEKNEKVVYFDRLTKKKADIITDARSYILLAYQNHLGCYVAVDYKLTEENKAIFNKSPRSYCY